MARLAFLFLDMNDVKFTQRIQAWFDAEHTDDNIREGAMLLLQMNNNRHLYQQIMLRPQAMLEHLKYNLQKHLGYRLKGMTLDEVRIFDKQVTPVLQAAVDKTAEADIQQEDDVPHLPFVDAKNIDSITPDAVIAKGKRTDHDQLPDDVKEIWETNAVLWKKIKQLFESCKAYTLSCDRFEGLNAANEEFKKMLVSLKEMYYAYKRNMDKYDHAEVDGETLSDEQHEMEVPITANQVGSARSYITKNLDKVIQLMADGKTDDAAKLRTKVQQRVQILIDAKADVKVETVSKLMQAGIEMPSVSSDKFEQQPDAGPSEEASDESRADTPNSETTSEQ